MNLQENAGISSQPTPLTKAGVCIDSFSERVVIPAKAGMTVRFE
jgi:hypothetical protein